MKKIDGAEKATNRRQLPNSLATILLLVAVATSLVAASISAVALHKVSEQRTRMERFETHHDEIGRKRRDVEETTPTPQDSFAAIHLYGSHPKHSVLSFESHKLISPFKVHSKKGPIDLVLDNQAIEIKVAGLYYFYGQIAAKPETRGLLRGFGIAVCNDDIIKGHECKYPYKSNKIISAVGKGTNGYHNYETINTGGLFDLDVGDRVALFSEKKQSISMRGIFTFFGGYMVRPGN